MTYDPIPLFVAYEATRNVSSDDPNYDALWDAYIRLYAEAPRCEVCFDAPIYCPTWDYVREEIR